MSDNDDSEQYLQWQELNYKSWESKCGRCGACCGSIEGDPCEHLRKDTDSRYSCQIYENRFGLHKTVSGKMIKCVPIRDILHKSWPGDRCCGYKK